MDYTIDNRALATLTS